jgi:hypothetical protein
MLTLGVLVAMAALIPLPAARAVSPNVVISQVYGGGGNSGATYRQDFIELFNRGGSPVSLAGWSVQYASATGTGSFGSSNTQITELPAVTLAPGQYLLIQEAQGSGGTTNLPAPDVIDATPIPMRGTGGKVALASIATSLGCNGGSTPCPPAALAQIVDLVGWDGANFFEGSPASATTNTTAVLRAGGGCTDTDNNGADFAAGAPSPRNSGSPLNACAGPTNPTGVGTASPASLPAGEATTLAVDVTPGQSPTSTGLAVTTDLGAIGGSPAQPFFDDGTNGDVMAGDLVFTFRATVSPETPAGQKNLPVTITDDQARTGQHDDQTRRRAPVALSTTSRAGPGLPYAGQLVATTGIVTGRKSNGFFCRPRTEADADPSTSEGLFVFTSADPPADAAVGNAVRVAGQLQEFVPATDPSSPPLTEITGSPAVTLRASGNPLPDPVTITALDTDPTGSIEQLERLAGMRVRVESLIVGLTGVDRRTAGTAARTGPHASTGVAGLSAAASRRPIHPPGAPCCAASTPTPSGGASPAPDWEHRGSP